jgi:hypothetical protein
MQEWPPFDQSSRAVCRLREVCISFQARLGSIQEGRLECIRMWGSILYGPVITKIPRHDAMLYIGRI